MSLECPPLLVSPTEVLGNMNNDGAKRMFKCFESNLDLTQAVCENGTWKGANCLGMS